MSKDHQSMKPFILVTVFCIALAQAVRSEEQDQAKQPKNRGKAAPAPQYVAPRQAPKSARDGGPVAVAPRMSRSQFQQQPYSHPNSRSYGNANVARPSDWEQNRINPRNPAPDRWVRKSREVARSWNQVPSPPVVSQPQASGSQLNAPARTRNWEQTGDWNNRNLRNHAYYNNWDQVRRRHDGQHHHRDWWRRHYTRFVLFGGGYYFWDNGYWFPAYGYDPVYNAYEYAEPIYGYDGLEPEQVIANVQTELQRLGYFPYAVDGQMGPMTRAAISNYQRDTGLAITSAIDEPTLQSLGLE